MHQETSTSVVSKHAALEQFLEPLKRYIYNDEIEEIQINRPGEIWYQVAGQEMQRDQAPWLDKPALLITARLIATYNNQHLSRESPIMSGTLPGGQRVQLVIPPACKNDQVIIAIRRYRLLDVSLEDLAERGLFPAQSKQKIQMLRDAVNDKKNIILSGGTFSGKTTLANALIKEIPKDEALVTIEDSAELNPPHENVKSLIYQRNSEINSHSPRDLFEAALRLRPDRVLAGELRGGEALMWLELINSDHPGSITTLHASSAEMVFDRIALMALTGGIKLEWEAIKHYVKGLVDVVVQIKRINGKRRVMEILS